MIVSNAWSMTLKKDQCLLGGAQGRSSWLSWLSWSSSWSLSSLTNITTIIIIMRVSIIGVSIFFFSFSSLICILSPARVSTLHFQPSQLFVRAVLDVSSHGHMRYDDCQISENCLIVSIDSIVLVLLMAGNMKSSVRMPKQFENSSLDEATTAVPCGAPLTGYP